MTDTSLRLRVPGHPSGLASGGSDGADGSRGIPFSILGKTAFFVTSSSIHITGFLTGGPEAAVLSTAGSCNFACLGGFVPCSTHVVARDGR